EEQPDSVATGRTLEEIAEEADRVWHSNKSVAQNVRAGAVRSKRGRSGRSTGKPARSSAFTREAPARAAKPVARRTEWRKALARMEGAPRAALPSFVEPALATLVKETPRGEEWLHEMKL